MRNRWVVADGGKISANIHIPSTNQPWKEQEPKKSVICFLQSETNKLSYLHCFFITEAEIYSGTVEFSFIGKCRWPLLSPCSFESLSSPQYCCNKFSPYHIFQSKTSHSKPAVILHIKSIHRTAEKVDISISKYKRVCTEGTSLIVTSHSSAQSWQALLSSGCFWLDRSKTKVS